MSTQIGIYIKNTLETFYFSTDDEKQRVLVNPYTETLLETALQLENELKLSLLGQLLETKDIQRWPDLDKELSLSTTKGLRTAIGRDKTNAFKLLPFSEKNRHLFAPYLPQLVLTTVDLSELVLKRWEIKSSDQTDLEKTVKGDINAKRLALSKLPGAPLVPDQFWKNTDQMSKAIGELQDFCLSKFGWTVTFDKDVTSFIYFYLPSKIFQVILLLAIITKTKPPSQEKMERFAQWHNIINYFWTSKPGKVTVKILDNSIDFTDYATLPIMYSMQDDNKRQFIYSCVSSYQVSYQRHKYLQI